MLLDIYNLVVSILGVLPVELTWVYGICTILVFSFVIIFVATPFAILYKIYSD